MNDKEEDFESEGKKPAKAKGKAASKGKKSPLESAFANLPKWPSELFVIPISHRPFFPGMAAPILIEQGPYYEILKQVAKSEEKYVALLLTKKENADVNQVDLDQLYSVGVLGRILRILPVEGGGAQVIINMESRLTVTRQIKHKYLRASVVYHTDEREITDELKAYAINVISVIKELLKLNPLFKEELQIFLGHSDFTEPGRLSDFACALTTATREELQEVLETFDIQHRIDKALVLLNKELDLSRLQRTIHQKIEATITKSQKEYYLREQLKTIKKELGLEKDEKTLDSEKFEARLAKLQVPAPVMQTIRDEMEKLATIEPTSAEYGVVRNYIDWLTLVPWGILAEERHELKKAEEILQKDHWGLDEIKTRILELIGVGQLAGSLKGSILCFVGPPGVGKTSVGKSIARALNRPFYRFSVGGMHDEAEIKGHRRTYVGAMPGKLIQALKTCQAMNPVIMIDEIDKLVSSFHGDPASSLLEVLDPEQNREFLDHYLDVRVDLSGVLFIVTANMTDTIPEPLLDRMEVLRLSGYITEEKLEIAKRYLIPKSRKGMGLTSKDISLSSDCVKGIINGYAREAGVRGLEAQIKKIMRKAALDIVREKEKGKAYKPHLVNLSNLVEYLGKPIYFSDRLYEKTPSGVATGLAWTAYGGATLYIETIKVPSDKSEMMLTGQAGDVMKESSQIAWSYLHSALHKYAPGYTFFEKSQVHIHIPEGATPKDGPSAGVTMVTALLSLVLDIPILADLAMSGEITLTGRVLAVGGVREKIVAARRANLKVLVLPKDNLRDFDELPPFLKKGLKVHFVDHYDEIFRIVFPGAK